MRYSLLVSFLVKDSLFPSLYFCSLLSLVFTTLVTFLLSSMSMKGSCTLLRYDYQLSFVSSRVQQVLNTWRRVNLASKLSAYYSALLTKPLLFINFILVLTRDLPKRGTSKDTPIFTWDTPTLAGDTPLDVSLLGTHPPLPISFFS